MAMRSIYIGQLVWSAAAPFIIRMRVHLGGVAIVYYYPHPAGLLFWKLSQDLPGVVWLMLNQLLWWLLQLNLQLSLKISNMQTM